MDCDELDMTRQELLLANEECAKLRAAIAKHHGQRADDRCVFDDDELYAAAGLPPADRRVGDKAAMLANCARFISRRCEEGGWPTYAELEARITALRAALGESLAFVRPPVADLVREFSDLDGTDAETRRRCDEVRDTCARLSAVLVGTKGDTDGR